MKMYEKKEIEIQKIKMKMKENFKKVNAQKLF
jgi:hypothetical protein